MTKDGETLLEVGIEAPVGEVAHCNLDGDEMKKVIVMMTTAIASSPVWEAAHCNPDPLEDTVARELVHDQGSFHLKRKSGD